MVQDTLEPRKSSSGSISVTVLSCLLRAHNIFALKKDKCQLRKDRLPFATTWADLEGMVLSEISQMGNDKNHMISFRCGV